MDNGMLMIIAAALILNCLLIYVIINAATHSDKRKRLAEAQTLLLINIAYAQGVDQNVVDGIKEFAKL
jgi:hypothetical protein